MIDRLDACTAIQGYLNWLEKLSDRNFVKFNSWKCKITHLGLNKPRQQYRLGTRLECSFAEEDLRVPVDAKFNMSQHVVNINMSPMTGPTTSWSASRKARNT